jgi:hypothetical protein
MDGSPRTISFLYFITRIRIKRTLLVAGTIFEANFFTKLYIATLFLFTCTTRIWLCLAILPAFTFFIASFGAYYIVAIFLGAVLVFRMAFTIT